MKTHKEIALLFAVTAPALLLHPLPSTAQLEEVRKISICGGKQGLTYARYARNLGSLLNTGFRIEPSIRDTDGGPHNVDLINEGKCDVGFAQGDTVMAKNPPLDLLGRIGMECGFFVVHKDGNVNDDDDFEDDGISPTLAVGGQGSGAAWSWRYIVQLDEDFSNTALTYDAGAVALTKLLSNQIDAVVTFTDPTKIALTTLGKAVEENDALEWLDFEDSSMNNKLDNGERVYTFEDVDVPGQWSDLETICTGLYVVASRGMPPKVKEALAQVILANPKGVTR